MKYARTKERIFICKFPENCRTIKDNEIIAKADTIEELCDEFVVNSKDENEPYWQYCNFDTLEEAKKSYDAFKHNNHDAFVFGAIWTDRGLLFVAKMNDKGEMELL